MADPKLVLEADDDDDLVLESIAPSEGTNDASTVAPALKDLALSTRGLPSEPSHPNQSSRVARPPPALPSASSTGGVPPPPPSQTSNTRADPPPSPRSVSSPVDARPLRLNDALSAPDSSKLQTIPAPPRRTPELTPPAARSLSASSDRSSVTAREARSFGAQDPASGSPPLVAAPAPADKPAALPLVVRPASSPSSSANATDRVGPAPPIVAVPTGTNPGFRSVATPSGLVDRSPLSRTSVTSARQASMELNTYRQQSALMRLLGPFIEDPRPRWLLAGYFLVGVAIGMGAAFGIWG